MITSNITSEDVARYYIVQHVPDVFRRECRNVGVIVERQGVFTCRFFGERGDGELDGRSIRAFEYPSVYKQWVNYWRRIIKRGGSPKDVLDRLRCANGDNYNVIDGGNLDGTLGDDLSQVCQYTYSVLVSEGGLQEALALEQPDTAQREALKDDLIGTLKELKIISQQSTMFLPNPVRQDWPLRGEDTTHTFTLAQENNGWEVIEPVTYSARTKVAAKDHAGWASHAFNDVRAMIGDEFRPIVVLKYSDADAKDPLLAYSIEMLAKAKARFVNWNDQADRRNFVKERESIALRK